MSLMIFGFGYSARYFVEHYGHDFAPITATVRDPLRAKALSSATCKVVPFGDEIDPSVMTDLQHAHFLLISTPPHASGDPVLEKIAEQMSALEKLERIVYLSTVGVYGDYDGAWIDETALCKPSNDRSHWRLAAEEEWIAIGRELNVPTDILRLAGIYGPRQNALAQIKAGTAKCINKPGQVFNRIHVEDIARSIKACFEREEQGGVWNVCDDEPAPPQDVVQFAAQLLGVTPPPEIDFNTADLSPMARSFYSECKRVSNRALKEKLGVSLAFPTYREGLNALLQQGEGQ
jgi:nucleoside-diphosphate-sugar epimerase